MRPGFPRGQATSSGRRLTASSGTLLPRASLNRRNRSNRPKRAKTGKVRAGGAAANAFSPKESWDGGFGAPARMCLLAGEIELREQGDVGGIGVHIDARVMAEAAVSEVLVSSTVKDLVVGSGLEFDERGLHSLKGVPGKWSLFAVRQPKG